MSFIVALRKDLKEQWRSYRMLTLLVVFLIFGFASPLLAKLAPELIRLVPNGDQLVPLLPTPGIADAVGQYVKNLSQFGILLAVLLSMGAVAQEKDKGTAALILAKPMPRWAFLAAKFAALAITFTVATLAAGIGAYYYTLLLFEAMDLAGWVGLNLLLIIFFLVFVALTLLASTIARSQVAAGALGIGALVLILTIGAIPGLGQYLPTHLLAWGSGLVLGGVPAAWTALAVSLGLVAGSLLLAWAVFERQEL